MGIGHAARVVLVTIVVMCLLLISGMIAGATGAFIGTPAEVSLIRMTSDGRLLSLNILFVDVHIHHTADFL